MNANDVRGVSLSQVENSKSSSVWVLNVSGGAGRSKGIVNISITEGNGRSSVVRVPVTKIPVDLTTQATKAALMMSPIFRRLIAGGHLLKLISDADAERMLSTPEAQQEYRRLMSVDREDGIQDTAPAEVQSILAEAEGNIGGFAMNIAHMAEGNEDDIVVNMRNNAENLSPEELQYIVNNSTFSKVKAAAAELIVK